MYETKEFQAWLKMKIAEKQGILAQIEEEVDRQMKNIKVEVKDEKGLWKKE